MTDAQATAWRKAVDAALWEAWRRNHTLSIVHSRRVMNGHHKETPCEPTGSLNETPH